MHAPCGNDRSINHGVQLFSPLHNAIDVTPIYSFNVEYIENVLFSFVICIFQNCGSIPHAITLPVFGNRLRLESVMMEADTETFYTKKHFHSAVRDRRWDCSVLTNRYLICDYVLSISMRVRSFILHARFPSSIASIHFNSCFSLSDFDFWTFILATTEQY